VWAGGIRERVEIHFLPLSPSSLKSLPFVTMNRFLLIALALVGYVGALSTSFIGSTRISMPRTCSSLQMKVVDIDSEAAFDKTIKSAGESLVVVDYSTTWCGPCKVIAPKFDELSDKYPDAVFLKVRVLMRIVN
jgi:thiol-disulfide isomerase/thioredoxin